MLKVNPASIYSMWLDKIVNTHVTQAWSQPQTEDDEKNQEWFHEQWDDLDERRRRRLCGLSADLHTLRDRETFVESDWPPMTQEELAQEQSRAFLDKDWDRLLESLRRPPKFRARDEVDYMRGRAWMEMRQPRVALLFFDNASRLNPQNPAYRIFAISCLVAMRAWDEVVLRVGQYSQDPQTPPRLLYRAADALHQVAIVRRQSEFSAQAIRLVDEGFARLKSGQNEPLESVMVGAHATKAFSLQHLARPDEALTAWDAAIAAFPENSALWIARGMLKREIGRADARDDLQHAIDLGTPLVWPYLELAGQALRANAIERTVQFSRLGLQRTSDDTIRAELLNIEAVALWSLKRPLEEVQGAFREATDLDPSNDEIRFNIQILQAHAGSAEQASPPWRISSRTLARAVEELRTQLRAAA